MTYLVQHTLELFLIVNSYSFMFTDGTTHTRIAAAVFRRIAQQQLSPSLAATEAYRDRARSVPDSTRVSITMPGIFPWRTFSGSACAVTVARSTSVSS